MSDYYSIQDLGGTQLAKAYPDRGVMSESPWARAVLTVAVEPRQFWGLFGKSERFIAMVSGNAEGLRVFVALDNFAMFVPWSALAVTGERSTPGTTVCLRTQAVPGVKLELHLDDAAADRLFQGMMPALPRREPPGRLGWPKPGAVWFLLVITVAIGLLSGSLHLDAVSLVLANIAAAFALAVMWLVCKPLFEERS